MQELEPDFHFIAIGGVGQSALALILLKLGYKVSGSDIAESKYTKLVQSLGGRVFIGHDEKNIVGNPKIVISSAIKENNPELKKAKAQGLEILHRSDCLKLISEKFPCFIGLAGTHGKTTTSGLLSFLFEKLNLNPSYAIGGIIPKYNTNSAADKNSRYFIAELDESDGTIIKYSPKMLVINNLEADHLDFYKNGLEDIFLTFEKLIDNLSDDAVIFINNDNEGNREFLEKIASKNKNIKTYGLKEAFYKAQNIQFDELTSSFDFYRGSEKLGKINLIIPGLHNIYNALAILSVLDNLGLKFDDYAPYFSEFSGMGRRFQLVADNKGIKIIDDYAHHPSEIKSTLSALNSVQKRKVVIFQPHRYTRLKGLWEEFLNSFNNIDKLFVLDVFNAGDEFDNQFNSKNFVEEIKKLGADATYIEGNIKEAAKKIAPQILKNDVVLTLGAGDITKIGGEINDLFSN